MSIEFIESTRPSAQAELQYGIVAVLPFPAHGFHGPPGPRMAPPPIDNSNRFNARPRPERLGAPSGPPPYPSAPPYPNQPLMSSKEAALVSGMNETFKEVAEMPPSDKEPPHGFGNGFPGGVRPVNSSAFSGIDFANGIDYQGLQEFANPELVKRAENVTASVLTWGDSFHRTDWEFDFRSTPWGKRGIHRRETLEAVHAAEQKRDELYAGKSMDHVKKSEPMPRWEPPVAPDAQSTACSPSTISPTPAMRPPPAPMPPPAAAQPLAAAPPPAGHAAVEEGGVGGLWGLRQGEGQGEGAMVAADDEVVWQPMAAGHDPNGWGALVEGDEMGEWQPMDVAEMQLGLSADGSLHGLPPDTCLADDDVGLSMLDGIAIADELSTAMADAHGAVERGGVQAGGAYDGGVYDGGTYDGGAYGDGTYDDGAYDDGACAYACAGAQHGDGTCAAAVASVERASWSSLSTSQELGRSCVAVQDGALEYGSGLEGSSVHKDSAAAEGLPMVVSGAVSSSS